MPHPRMRTAVRLGATAAATALLSAGFAGIPAQAAAPENLFALMAPDAQTILPQSALPQGSAFRTIRPVVLSEGSRITGVTITVDASELVGVAELSLPSQCRYTDKAELRASCTVGTVGSLDPAGVDLGIRAVAGAPAGAQGRITFAATATNAVEDTEGGVDDTTPVTVGDGADLAAQQLGSLTVKPGGSTAFTPQVTNLGDRDSHGVVMFIGAESLGLDGSSGFSIGGNYSNCHYGVGDVGDPADSDTGVLCRFDSTVIHPGEVLVPSAPVTVLAARSARSGMVAYGFDVTGGALDTQTTKGHPGTGPALTLVPAPAARQARPGPGNVDIDYDNNVAYSPISTGQADDVAAVGADVHGTVGRALPVTVGVRNVGTLPTPPLDGAPSPKDTAIVMAAFPQGVSITRAPADCQSVDLSDPTQTARLPQAVRSALSAHRPADDGGLPGDIGAVYGCLVDHVLKPGQSALFSFTAKPTRVLDQAQGEVVAVGPDDDATPQNNLAALTVSAVRAGASSAPTAAPSAPASASASAPATAAPSGPAAPGSGSLAGTGGGDDSLPLAGVGAVAVLLGAGAVALTRRRRSGGRG
ncbi:hypothetical protein GXW83_31450 [Streptacidiphilus sp. PB12-B1b]|uniref:hypothetical protein n=1 Tax=Streptacidiphilus sp. PB12-B1b TaxID=2705012 RepID=UPI0015FDFDA6|nr:hypothetical protein [Streptacidiphilus sp. PB12-B1b]QMU79549.1 hypothetical protein GXW83_31450 [Streptacidiphilus sp. PB12-B1b]